MIPTRVHSANLIIFALALSSPHDKAGEDTSLRPLFIALEDVFSTLLDNTPGDDRGTTLRYIDSLARERDMSFDDLMHRPFEEILGYLAQDSEPEREALSRDFSELPDDSRTFHLAPVISISWNVAEKLAMRWLKHRNSPDGGAVFAEQMEEADKMASIFATAFRVPDGHIDSRTADAIIDHPSAFQRDEDLPSLYRFNEALAQEYYDITNEEGDEK